MRAKIMPEDRRELSDYELSVAARLKAAAIAAKSDDRRITQEYIAEQVKSNQPLIALYLNGKRPINTDTLFDICAAIGVNVKDIDPKRAKKITFKGEDTESRFMNRYLSLAPAKQKIIEDLMAQLED